MGSEGVLYFFSGTLYSFNRKIVSCTRVYVISEEKTAREDREA